MATDATRRCHPPPVIDAHAHVGRWREPSFGGRATDLADATAVYGECGFAGALLMPTDEGDNEALGAALTGYHGPLRLRRAWWVDPSGPDSADQLLAAAPTVAALKIHPSFLRTPVTAAAFNPYFTFAAAHGWPVVVHCGRWRAVAGFEHALDRAAAHPGVNLVLSHMGGDEPLLVRETVAAILARGLTNVLLGTESVRQYWVVDEALQALGPERIVFGSDYNLNHPRAFLAIAESLGHGLPERTRALSLVLGGNLNRIVPRALRFFEE